MTEAGFLETRRASPTGAVLVTVLHGAAIAALLLAKAPIVEVPDFIQTKLYPVDEPPPAPAEEFVKKPPPPDVRPADVPPVVDLGADREGPVIADIPEPLPPQEAIIVVPAPQLPSIDQSARAKGDLRALIGAEDYPDAARRDEVEGRVQVRLDVGSNGRATGCTVVESSGSAQLDSATCRVLKARARFTPARDASGAAITDSYVAPRIVWKLLDD